ncbi:unnamed protein product [Microthlaspi erraticum]|uniref:Uncharacterized protein n=1 Tax=Microthlaspi erraticum TaxID=1685480 RepID=A0A6D2HNI7_9BRAS|nr:unnamed protein product [Microthlaspi erraticum]
MFFWGWWVCRQNDVSEIEISDRVSASSFNPISDNLLLRHKIFIFVQLSQWFTGCSLSIHIGCFVFSPSSVRLSAPEATTEKGSTSG